MMTSILLLIGIVSLLTLIDQRIDQAKKDEMWD